MDLSLVIRPFGSTKCNKSVEEALDFFVKPETLTDGNKVECDVCGKKTESVKGLQLAELPEILLLQLKRFDFDYNTMQRVKLNDAVSFPLWLNMNEYSTTATVSLASPTSSSTAAAAAAAAGGEAVTAVAVPAPAPVSVDADGDVNTDVEPSVTVAVASKSEDAAATSTSTAGGAAAPAAVTGRFIPEDMEPAEMVAKFGPNVYELYAVLVHSGGALGGHYYAYIKNMDTGLWYNFNDSSVSEISVRDVKGAFGGSTTTASGYSYSSSASAYMLLYRYVWFSSPSLPAFPSDCWICAPTLC